MSDTLYGSRRFRTLNVPDEGVREGLAIEIDTSLQAERVIRAERAIELRHIQPGKPDQTAFIERYNRTYRTEVLSTYVFDSLEQVREIREEWGCRVTTKTRLHESLAGLPPPRIGLNLKPEVPL